MKLLLELINGGDINTYAQTYLKINSPIQRVTVAGQGNMNLVLRLETIDYQHFIVKKSFSFVYKYPQVAAPLERNRVEAQFYQQLQPFENIQIFLAQLLFYDEQNQLLWLEDLGETADFGHLYGLKTSISAAIVQQLMQFLSILHAVKPSNSLLWENRAMRQLNHEYIFVNPFQANNGINLDATTAGLGAVAADYLKDELLLTKIKLLGDLYLKNGDVLLHGDFYPNSWLTTAQGLKIIDFEFTFGGFAEFDLSVLYAHLCLTFQSEQLFWEALQHYENCERLDIKLIKAWAGAEIFRRLLGLAQLPLAADLAQKDSLLKKAYQLIMNDLEL